MKTKEELRKRKWELHIIIDQLFDEALEMDDYKEAIKWYNSQPEVIEYGEVGAQLRMIEEYKLDQLPEYGDHMTMNDFIKDCKDGYFTDDDGIGAYATEDKVSNIEIYPSDVISGFVRKDFKYVVWYNK